jgi:uncharacterized membrane protein YeaQ/YmgE (transglycosylase-associated protein family)
MPSKSTNKVKIVMGGIVGFLLGIVGNLLATWIQQDLLQNSFTPVRISLIILCSIFGIFVIAISDTSKGPARTREKLSTVNKENFYSRLRLAWSKFKTRGKGIHAEDISAIGSEIDIDTNKKYE